MPIQWKTISFAPADPSWRAIYGDDVLSVAGWLTQKGINGADLDCRVVAGIVNGQGEVIACDQKPDLIEIVQMESVAEE